MTDEYIEAAYKKLKDRQNSIGAQASNLPPWLKAVWAVLMAAGIYLITKQTPENNNTLPIIIGMAIVSWIILKSNKSNKLTDFELRICCFQQILALQEHPIGAYSAIPQSAKVWVTLLCIPRALDKSVVKEFGIKWENDFTGEVFEGAAAVDINDGNLHSVEPRPLGHDPRTRKPFKYVSTEDLKKMSYARGILSGKV